MTEIKEKKPRKSRAKASLEATTQVVAPLEVNTAITLPVEKVFKTNEQMILEVISAEIEKEKRNKKA